ncbi:MAG: hypothetical protein M1818_008507 [Claussenomyces sp. TS43310]|nr:MAG: hypothetical protein M1818_008507 [Claussenomyces sp. TS43310]
MKLFGLRSPMNGCALLALLATTVLAFWRMECRARVGVGRIDPLMNFGEAGAHVHSIHGSSGFSETATYETLLDASCTSCVAEQDKSAYWTPSLYFQAADGKFTLVNQVGGMLAYYLLYSNTDGTLPVAFPARFKMIAGDNFRRNFSGPVPDADKSSWDTIPGYMTQESLTEKATGFNCLNYNKAPEGSFYRHFLPDKAYLDANCVDGLRFELMFPSCWNGKDVDSADHKSHVAYPNLVTNGDCPSGYDTRLVSLMYETIWDTYAFKGQDGQFVIANGDPTGYGYHGDFMMGWDEDVLDKAVQSCTDSGGDVYDCPVFTFQDSDAYSNCNITTPSNIANDDVYGPASTLPGNILIQSGPAQATPGSAQPDSEPSSPSASSTVPVLSYAPGTSVSGSSVTGGPFDILVETSGTQAVQEAPASPTSFSSETSASTSSAIAVITSAAVLSDAGLLPNQNIFSTLWTTSGREVLEYILIEETVEVPEATTTTAVVEAVHKRSHLHRHARRHHY